MNELETLTINELKEKRLQLINKRDLLYYEIQKIQNVLTKKVKEQKITEAINLLETRFEKCIGE